MQNILKAIGKHVKTAYEAQHDPERTQMQSVALRIFGSEHPATQQWTRGELTDSEFYVKALNAREETTRYYPDARFQLGDSVRFEQKPMHVYGYIRGVDVFKGMFLYAVAFIDGETHKLNEAFLHRWHTTPIE